MLRVFFDACHRHGWLPGLAASATIYVEELPFHHDEIARFIPEFVMAQLESDEALAKIPHTTTRHLVVVMIETGLRGGDACTLPFNPVLDRQRRLALPALRGRQGPRRAADPAQRQGRGGDPRPAGLRAPALARGQPVAVPRDHRQRRRLQALLAQHLHPAARALAARHRPARRGRPAGHRDRSPVPSHPRDPADQLRRPAARRAKAPRPCQPAHDQPLRQGPRHHHPGGVRPYQSQRVNIAGERIGYDPDAPTASAEWVKHNLNRVRDSLPNGYCGRPAQQDCPHPNACLTCPDFQTTPEFLQIHRRQATTNRRLITQADANGQHRLAENLRRVQASLDRIIPALEALQHDGPGDDPS